MARHFLMISPPMPSHMYAAGALGRELQSRGHRVTFVGVRDVQTAIEKERIGYAPIGEQTHPPGRIAQFKANLEKVEGLNALKLTLAEVERMNQTYFRELPNIAQRLDATDLIADQAEPSAGAIAEHCNLRWTTTCVALPINREPDVPPYFTAFSYAPGLLTRARNQIGYAAFDFFTRGVKRGVASQRRQWNLPPYTHPDQASSPTLQIAQTIREFDWPRQHLPRSFHYVGPFRREDLRDVPFAWERLPNSPFVYASLGTFQNRLTDVFTTIARACADAKLPLVLSLGGGMRVEEVGTLPGNPVVVEFAPQIELLKRASIFITHGGLNSAHEALLTGTPCVVVPILGDQGGVAARMEYTGAGVAIPFKKLTPEKLASALRNINTVPTYKQNAERLRQAMERTGGVRQAADLIEGKI